MLRRVLCKLTTFMLTAFYLVEIKVDIILCTEPVGVILDYDRVVI